MMKVDLICNSITLCITDPDALRGVNLPDSWKGKILGRKQYSRFHEDFLVCILNGPTRMLHKGMMANKRKYNNPGCSHDHTLGLKILKGRRKASL